MTRVYIYPLFCDSKAEGNQAKGKQPLILILKFEVQREEEEVKEKGHQDHDIVRPEEKVIPARFAPFNLQSGTGIRVH